MKPRYTQHIIDVELTAETITNLAADGLRPESMVSIGGGKILILAQLPATDEEIAEAKAAAMAQLQKKYGPLLKAVGLDIADLDAEVSDGDGGLLDEIDIDEAAAQFFKDLDLDED